MKYRRKPYEVDAEQFFVVNRPHPKEVCFCVASRGCAHIHTLKGIRRLQSGDWVIRTPNGTVYSDTHTRFIGNYEEVKP